MAKPMVGHRVVASWSFVVLPTGVTRMCCTETVGYELYQYCLSSLSRDMSVE